MIKIEDLKPIPDKIKDAILKESTQFPFHKFYGYLTTISHELVKVTVALKTYRKKTYMKQIAIHGVDSDYCLIKDVRYNYMGGYSVGWFSEGITNYQAYWDDNIWDSCLYKYYRIYAPVVNLEYIKRFKKFKYSAIELADCHSCVIDYLRMYKRFPELEYVTKLGLLKYNNSVQILKACRKDKRFRKWLAKNRHELNEQNYNIPPIMKAYKSGIMLKDAQEYFSLRSKLVSYGKDYKNILNYFKNTDDLINYIQSQKTNLDSYKDYFTACNYLHLDMSLPKNYKPHNFKHWHDVRIDEMHSKKAEEDKEKRQELYLKFANVSNKYSSLQRNLKDLYVTLIPTSPQDLINEGELLHHCVGRMGYDQKFIREETLIFFIREKNNISTPLATVEYSLSKKSILQCYGDHDSKPNQEIIDYVYSKWLPYANRKIKKIAA